MDGWMDGHQNNNPHNMDVTGSETFGVFGEPEL